MRLDRTSDIVIRTQWYKIDGGREVEWTDRGVLKRVVGCSKVLTINGDIRTTRYRVSYKRVKKNGDYYEGGAQNWDWEVPKDIKLLVQAEVDRYDA